MPNRILKESICVSDSIDSLTWFEEVLFYRLIVNCDDYGRFDGRAPVIKSRLFPLKDNLTLKSVSEAINKLVSAGLVTLYEYEGKPFLLLPTWNDHQIVRAKRSKYPAPGTDCMGMKTSENICMQMISDESICPRNPIQSESESESNTSAEPQSASAPSVPPVITILLNTGAEYPVSQADVDEWAKCFPAVDVMQQLREMRAWSADNPAKRKTVKGVRRFIVSWLMREQDKGGNWGRKSSRPAKNALIPAEQRAAPSEKEQWEAAMRTVEAGRQMGLDVGERETQLIAQGRKKGWTT